MDSVQDPCKFYTLHSLWTLLYLAFFQFLLFKRVGFFTFYLSFYLFLSFSFSRCCSCDDGTLFLNREGFQHHKPQRRLAGWSCGLRAHASAWQRALRWGGRDCKHRVFGASTRKRKDRNRHRACKARGTKAADPRDHHVKRL